MMRSLTTIGCSMAMALGTAGFLGCEEQGAMEGQYGTETEVREGLDTQAPALDGTGVGLDTSPMRDPAITDPEPTPATPGDRPGMGQPQDLQQESNTPTIP